MTHKALFLAAGVAAALAMPSAGTAAGTNAASIDGRWRASLSRDGTDIPFRLDIAGSGKHLKGTLYDGFEPYEGTTSASYENGNLTLNIEHYLTSIQAHLEQGKLVGTVTMQNRAQPAQYAFVASRFAPGKTAAPGAPAIAGSWEIPLETPSSKGERAFRFIVRQQGADVAASILRVDGDTGAFSGTFTDGKWVLSHFDGSRPGVITVTPGADGTLTIQQRIERPERAAREGAAAKPYGEDASDGRYAATFTAYRTEVARAQGLPEPANYETHTTVRDPNERFTFSFPDTDGRLVTNEDPRFKGKVVLAIVTGTWCPNCHDEAQYLVELDKKYRDRGLAIVALDFEEPEQQSSLVRERAFVDKYGVKYTYLIAGAPAEMWEKVPQAVNLNTWPATLFIDREGKVRSIHSGFASRASGEFHEQLKQEFTAKIEKLLAERPVVADGGAPAAGPPLARAN